MVQDKDEASVIDNVAKRTKNLYCAGLGAVGNVLDVSQTGIEKLNIDSGRLYQEYIGAGQKFQDSSKVRFEELKQKSSSNLQEQAEKLSLDLGWLFSSSSERQLQRKVDGLNAKLDELISAVEKKAKPAASIASKKTSKAA